ncbi:MAG: ADP-forming succinate--CoA ligase subunit beta [Candidatus Dormibacteraceae bacterium]
MAQLTEHLSKQVLARFGIATPRGVVAMSAAAAAAAQEEFAAPVMVKAQVPASGRGKAGGILRADSGAAAAAAFERVTSVHFGRLRAETALVEGLSTPLAELYLGVSIDAGVAGPALLFSAAGGVDVEAAAATRLIPLRRDGTVPAAALRRAAYGAGLNAAVTERLVSLAGALARAHAATDAYLIELNPVAVLEGDRLAVLDARLVADDNAMFRQPYLRALVAEMRPRHEEDLVRERTQLEFVQLDGSLGLLSGGAGMTMAAMDLIADLGGRPACFLDCSNNPTPEGYGEALELLLTDPKVGAILISIFGGLTQMDRVARTLVALFAARKPDKPITLRLMGTNIEAADLILGEAGLHNHRLLEDAVRAAVATVPEVLR